MTEGRKRARELAEESLSRGDALGWFDTLYKNAAGDTGAVPWADLRPNPALVNAAKARARKGTALVVGCGLGDDAEYLVDHAERVVAFDFSAEAIAWCTRRFPKSPVAYEVGDLLAPPPSYVGAFDFVFEAYTLQSLPPEPRARGAASLATFVAKGGTLVVVARATDTLTPIANGPPWPLTREEVMKAGAGLTLVALEEWREPEDPTRRFLATFERKS